MALTTIFDSVELSREFFISFGAPGLFAVAFLEFFLLPVPPDLVLIPLAVVRPEFALLYAVVATAGSVSAGFIGFLVGRAGGRPLLSSRFATTYIEKAERYVDQRGFGIVVFAAFAPIPEGFELLSVASGVFGLRPRSYLLASLAGRGGRYLLEAVLVVTLGEAARSVTETELYAIIGVVSLLAVASYLSRRWWLPDHWTALRD